MSRDKNEYRSSRETRKSIEHEARKIRKVRAKGEQGTQRN